MKKYINKYLNSKPHERSVYSTNISVIINIVMFIGKLILSFIFNLYFLISGIMNLFICISKIYCLKGLNKDIKEIPKYNKIIGTCLITSGIVYGIYMARLIYSDIEIFDYGMILGIIIACVAFTELSIAILGVFRIKQNGNYFINIKLINISTALTAISLTELAIMSFASETDSRFLDGLFGIIIGLLIAIIGLYIIISFKYTIVNKEHYEIEVNNLNNQDIKITLYESKIYSGVYFEGSVNNKVLTGSIKKTPSPITSYNLFLLILVITLSEILIFPYAIGALINHFKGKKLIDKLYLEVKELDS